MENRREEARAYSNLGSTYHSQRDFDKAISYHTKVLELARELSDRSIEMRAFAGLGHAARCMQVGRKPFQDAHCRSSFLNYDLLNIIFIVTFLQDLERARQYHQSQLEIAQELQDRAAQGRASSNLGNSTPAVVQVLFVIDGFPLGGGKLCQRFHTGTFKASLSC